MTDAVCATGGVLEVLGTSLKASGKVGSMSRISSSKDEPELVARDQEETSENRLTYSNFHHPANVVVYSSEVVRAGDRHQYTAGHGALGGSGAGLC
jgi:hypothetical protein